MSDVLAAPLLEIAGLNAGYGRSQVLFDLSLTVPATGAIAILGRNGAGKTTLLKTIAGEIRPMSGRIRLGGEEVAGTAPERRARLGIGHVPQEDAIFARMSVRENLLLGGGGAPPKSAIEEMLNFFPKLGTRLNQTAATLSGGERKMLAISRALLGRPRVLLLDEPTEGVWVGVIEEIADRLLDLSKRMSIVLVEQHVELALRVAGAAYVMDRGSIALHGPAAEIRHDPALLRYLAP
ncbi:ABC transporter ATP-binding protein [Paracraurococcus lichenis]|uniref:ABC transporter ATP-binding protein n=1 Tax=Paracraurococcus lichenis TaxID=3064888 RepID=A0ABT9E6F5_9PROT|nr:ABC transporter ATP-binding protein [Paracraurococcus sp. LOR1-02]MDO9711570.1 ABC transporter ATP-binding protein [Paracraurococcus sp. LOR1-02]